MTESGQAAAAAAAAQQRVLQALADDLERQQAQWRPAVYSDQPEEGDVGVAERQAAVRWLERQCHRLGFHADSLCLAVTLLDAFLGRVRAKARYMTCMALTCLYLAAKLCEEDELVPTVTYLVERTRPGCSRADVLRMERLALARFGWQVRLVTPLSFLQSLHALLTAACPPLLRHRCPPLSGHRQLSALTSRLTLLVTDGRAAAVPPACLAAALVCDELRRCPATAAAAAAATAAAAKLIKCSPAELAAAVARVRAVLGAAASVLEPAAADAAAAKRPRQRGDSRSFSRPAKRQLVAAAELTDDIVGDIRRLYAGEPQPLPAAGPRQPPAATAAAGVAVQQCRRSSARRLSYAEVLRHNLPVPAA